MVIERGTIIVGGPPMVMSAAYRFPILIGCLAGLILCSFPCTASCLQARQIQQERVSALCDSGFVLLDRQEFESARSIFKEILDRERNHPEALLGMGRAMLGLPRGGGRALEYLMRAVAQAPENIEAHFHKARVDRYIRMSFRNMERP